MFLIAPSLRFLTGPFSLSPKTICTLYEGGKEDVDLAVRAAHRALSGPWKDVSARDRGRILLKLADLIEK